MLKIKSIFYIRAILEQRKSVGWKSIEITVIRFDFLERPVNKRDWSKYSLITF